MISLTSEAMRAKKKSDFKQRVSPWATTSFKIKKINIKIYSRTTGVKVIIYFVYYNNYITSNFANGGKFPKLYTSTSHRNSLFHNFPINQNYMWRKQFLQEPIYLSFFPNVLSSRQNKKSHHIRTPQHSGRHLRNFGTVWQSPVTQIRKISVDKLH